MYGLKPVPLMNGTLSSTSLLSFQVGMRENEHWFFKSIPLISRQAMQESVMTRELLSSEPSVFIDVPTALEEIRAGRMVVVVDDEDRENEGDLTLASEFVTPAAINFMA